MQSCHEVYCSGMINPDEHYNIFVQYIEGSSDELPLQTGLSIRDRKYTCRALS